jgi:hypothetical protein
MGHPLFFAKCTNPPFLTVKTWILPLLQFKQVYDILFPIKKQVFFSGKHWPRKRREEKKK